jgi:DNA primase
MAEIWSALSRPGPTSTSPASQPSTGPADDFDRRRALAKSRDEAIRRLVPAEKQPELEKIFEDFSAQMTELSERRRRTYEAAVEKTKAILTPEQREKYEKILAERGPSHHGQGPGGPGRGWPRNPSAEPITTTATQQAPRDSPLPPTSNKPSTQSSNPN